MHFTSDLVLPRFPFFTSDESVLSLLRDHSNTTPDFTFLFTFYYRQIINTLAGIHAGDLPCSPATGPARHPVRASARSTHTALFKASFKAQATPLLQQLDLQLEAQLYLTCRPI